MKPKRRIKCTWDDYEAFKRELNARRLTANEYEAAIWRWLERHDPQ